MVIKKNKNDNKNVLVTSEKSYDFYNVTEKKDAASTETVEFKQFFRPSNRPSNRPRPTRRRTTVPRTTVPRRTTTRAAPSKISLVLRGRFRENYLLILNFFLRLIRMQAVVVESSPTSVTIVIVPSRQ